MNARLLAAVVVAQSLVLAACGEPTPCDDSLDKAESCGIEGYELTDAGEACEAFAACQAACINKGSCNDIREVIQNPTADNAVNRCATACGE